MTIDEEAAKVVEQVLAEFPGVWTGGRQREIFKSAIAAFARRCAEAEREACARVAETTDKWDCHSNGGDIAFAFKIAQAIRQRGIGDKQ